MPLRGKGTDIVVMHDYGGLYPAYRRLGLPQAHIPEPWHPGEHHGEGTLDNVAAARDPPLEPPLRRRSATQGLPVVAGQDAKVLWEDAIRHDKITVLCEP